MSATSGIVLLEAALPAGIVLPRQLKLPLSMTKLFFDLCWIKSLGDVLERRFDADARQRPRTADSTKLNRAGPRAPSRFFFCVPSRGFF